MSQFFNRASKLQVKISDFGLSTVMGDGKDYYQASQGGRCKYLLKTTQTKIQIENFEYYLTGPIKWYAPESVNYGTFSHASDVWR